METVPVLSAEDPRLADYVRLTDMSLRTHLEAEHGLFIAEGAKVITRAAAAGYPVRSVLLAQSRKGDLPSLLPPGAGAPVYLVPDEVAERLTGFRVHRGALASMERKPLPPVPGVIAGARRIVVLEDLVDHANVGAIFRSAAALGVDAVVLSPRCADPLYRRAVKVSMGAVFSIRYARMTEWFHGLATLREAGFRILALTPDDDAVPLEAALRGAPEVPGGAPEGGPRGGLGGEQPPNKGIRKGGKAPFGKYALLLGTEGDGLSSRWRHEADQSVRIPMDPGARAAGVDSLNVVAAAAIACHMLAGIRP